jgi:hypothetical protein
MSVATESLPQVLLKQYEQLATRYAQKCAECDAKETVILNLTQQLEVAEELLVRYESATAEELEDIPHHINHYEI